jgi:hypothetical protein
MRRWADNFAASVRKDRKRLPGENETAYARRMWPTREITR